MDGSLSVHSKVKLFCSHCFSGFQVMITLCLDGSLVFPDHLNPIYFQLRVTVWVFFQTMVMLLHLLFICFQLQSIMINKGNRKLKVTWSWPVKKTFSNFQQHYINNLSGCMYFLTPLVLISEKPKLIKIAPLCITGRLGY